MKSPASVLRAAHRSVDRLVDATPPTRDRTVDFLRAFSIGVVVLWHWALSVTHRQDGRLVMPNPIQDVPFGWLATWLLQVMPLFFLVGGFANLAGWESASRVGGAAAFLRRRLARLLRPTALFVAVWVAVEGLAHLLLPGYRSVLDHALVVFVPLWFLAAYLWVVLLVPLTAAAHRRAGPAVAGLLGAAVVLVDAGRFAGGIEALGWVNTALVWVFVHQLGYLWRDGAFDEPARRGALVLAGLAGLVLVAAVAPYPRSMVATEGDEVSHMFPTTAGIAVLAVFQLGVVQFLRPALDAWLQRRAVWKIVVSVNAVIMTIFLWHMTALLLAITALERAGLELPAEPTAAWWVQRPLWVLVPGAILAVLVAVFARVEIVGRGTPSARQARR